MRDYLGCYDRGPATAPKPHFSGTAFETRRCPRALLILNPDVPHLLRIYSTLQDGRPAGAYGPDVLSAVAVEALGIIDRARGWRLEREIEERARERGKK